VKKCHRCGQEWVSDKRRPAFKEYCDKCSAYLHCCLNCRFYDPYAHNKCRIPTTDWVADRAGPNFCEDFEFADAADAPAAKDDDKREKARHALGDLFRDASKGDNGPKTGRDAFDALFNE